MALKLTIDDPVEVPGPLRSEYRKGSDGKFHLVLEGTHPDTAKLTEFREKNITLLREVDELRPLKSKYEGIDADAARSALAKLPDLETKLATFDGVDPEEYRTLKSRPDTSARAAQLETELATVKAAHAESVFRNAITVDFLRAGGRDSAVDYIVALAAKTFAVVDGQVTTSEFSTKQPGKPLAVAEWLEQQLKTSDFAFKPSNGGGTPPKGGGNARLGARSNAVELRNPTPQDLGQHASAIASGKMKIVFT